MYAVDEQDVIAMGADVVSTGQLTTSVGLQTLLALLANYQDVQEKAYREIQEIIGDRTPSYQDKFKLPYVQAVIVESLRYATIVPLNNVHCTNDDVELQGYLIPKGTLVVANIWSISHDRRHVLQLILSNISIESNLAYS